MTALETVGQIDVEPPLDDEGRAALATLTAPSPYDARVQPATPCGWVVCDDGCCLRLVAAESADDAAAWLRYIVDVLSEADQHRVVGLVASERDEDGEMFTVRVTPDREVRAELLRRGRARRPRLAPVIRLDRHLDRRRRGKSRRFGRGRAGYDTPTGADEPT